MKRKQIAFILLILIMGLAGTVGKAQTSSIKRLDNYKYVVIPMQFSFQPQENQYLLSSRIKHLLDEQGFHTVMKNQRFPDDLAFNRCLALYVEVKNYTDSFFSTHTALQVILKNCHNEVVYKTLKGDSKSKDLRTAYKEAVQNAFKSFAGYYYKYNGNKGIEPQEAAFTKTEKEEALMGPLSATLGKKYEHQGSTYEVNKISAGYLLINKTTGKRAAFLHITDNETILYNSKTINGSVTVKANGNMIVEYFDRSAGKLKKMVYRVQE